MRHVVKYTGLFLIACTFVSSCIEPYEPAATLDAPDILVVDGSISVSGQSAKVKITHAVALTSIAAPAPEPNAAVVIEELGGGSFQLIETEPGVYVGAGLPIDQSTKYRLSIQTSHGKRYASEYVELLDTSPIDSVTWRPSENGIEIFVNSHDDTERNKYYKWTFVETWKYTSSYQSFFNFDQTTGEVTRRELSEWNYTCFQTAEASTILVGSTNQLESNVVRNFRITTVPALSGKIGRGYSILVKQSSLTEEAYNYWQLLQRTTENLGGLFDPLPAQVTGNITCLTDASEPVLGYFSGGTESEKRLFIKPTDIPVRLQYVPRPDPDCPLDSLLFDDMPTSGPHYVINTFGVPFPVGYVLSSLECTDCRFEKGTLEVPDYWEN